MKISNCNYSNEILNNKKLLFEIFSIALPTLGFLAISPILLATDTFFIGHLNSKQLLASLSMGNLILNTSYSLFIFLTYGTTANVAIFFGRSNTRKAYTYGIQSLYLSCFIGIFLITLLYFFTDYIILFLGLESSVAKFTKLYVYACLPGLFSIIVSLSAVGILRGMLKNVLPLLAGISCALINVVLTFIFVYILKFSIVGAGIGTSISEMILASILVFAIVRKAIVQKADFKITADIFKHLLDNFPLFIRSLSLNASFFVLGLTLAHFGSGVIASHYVAYTVMVFLNFMLDSIGIASQSLIAIKIGNSNRNIVLLLSKKCISIIMLLSIPLGIIILCLSPFIPMIFTNDIEISANATVPIAICAIFLPIIAFAFVADGILIGAKDNKYIGYSSVLIFIIYALCLLLVSFFIPKSYALPAIWLCIMFGFYGTRTIIYGVRIFSYKWLK